MYGLSPKHHQQRTLTPIHLSFTCYFFGSYIMIVWMGNTKVNTFYSHFQIFILLFYWKCKIFCFIFVETIRNIMAVKEKLSVPDQVRVALDGRTQRWLALEIKMPEDNMSKRMTGVVEFTQQEIDSINERLKSNISK